MFRILVLFILLALPTVSSAREIPMWEGISKTQKMIEIDRKFVSSITKSGGKRKGADRANQLGWKFLSRKNPDMAIKRFNQAWLLDPSNANIYWGFAVAVHQQGRPISEVKRHFRKAEQGFSGNKKAMTELYADQGQVFGERRMFKESIQMFEKALKLNSQHSKSRRGIVLSAKAIGDSAIIKKYQ